MGILEEITNMKNQGQTEQEIISNLQERGISPKQINDALDQSQIKNAVSQTPNEAYLENKEINQPPTNPSQIQEMPYQSQPQYSQEDFPQQEYSQPQYSPQEYPSQQEYDNYSYGGGINMDANTMIEIAEQVFSNKIKKINKQLEGLDGLKILSQTKIDNISDRLKRIEEIIERLQINIIEKVGSYGQNLESIKKEMSMVQDSFKKIVNPLLDKAEHHMKKSSKKKTRKKHSS